jgi:hypothetical protein
MEVRISFSMPVYQKCHERWSWCTGMNFCILTSFVIAFNFFFYYQFFIICFRVLEYTVYTETPMNSVSNGFSQDQVNDFVNTVNQLARGPAEMTCFSVDLIFSHANICSLERQVPSLMEVPFFGRHSYADIVMYLVSLFPAGGSCMEPGY